MNQKLYHKSMNCLTIKGVGATFKAENWLINTMELRNVSCYNNFTKISFYDLISLYHTLRRSDVGKFF